MSISGISSNNYLNQSLYRINSTQTDFLKSSQSNGAATTATGSKDDKDKIATDLSALWEALQAGNLTSAQSYFLKLQQDVQAIGANASDNTQSTSTATASSSTSDSNPLANDLSTLEDALQSGDLTSAQNTFAKIMQHMQGPPPPPPPDANDSDTTQGTSTTTTSSSLSGSNPLADDLSTLENALQSGDLTSAQTILAQIMQHMQGPPPPPDANDSDSTQSTSTVSSSSSVSDSNPLAKDLSTLEEALQSGDLTSAQTILAQIMQHMQGPPPPDFNASDTTQSTSTTTASNSSSDSNPLVNDLTKLEEALQSGDLTSAQNIFSQIMQHMQPPDASATDSTQSTSTASLFSSANSDVLSKLIEAMLAAYSSSDKGSNSSNSYYA